MKEATCEILLTVLLLCYKLLTIPRQVSTALYIFTIRLESLGFLPTTNQLLNKITHIKKGDFNRILLFILLHLRMLDSDWLGGVH